MGLKNTKKILFAMMIALLTQMPGGAMDGAWGDMDVFGSSFDYENLSTKLMEQPSLLAIEEQKYPTSFTTSENSAANPSDKENKTIKNIEFYGLNSVSQEELTDKIQMKSGSPYTRELMQQDLKAIYETGYFTEKMKAVPIPNDPESVTLKVYVEENTPMTDFTVVGNTVINTGELLALAEPLQGQPQNLQKISEVVSEMEELYASKGYVLARVVEVLDDPDGCINFVVEEGVINSIKFEGNKKTKDFVIERNIRSTPGSV